MLLSLHRALGDRIVLDRVWPSLQLELSLSDPFQHSLELVPHLLQAFPCDEDFSHCAKIFARQSDGILPVVELETSLEV